MFAPCSKYFLPDCTEKAQMVSAFEKGYGFSRDPSLFVADKQYWDPNINAKRSQATRYLLELPAFTVSGIV